MRFASSCVASLLITACASAPTPARAGAPATSAAPSVASTAPSPMPPAPSSLPVPAASSLVVAPPRPCGALDCLAFVSAEAAFTYVLQSKPQILAVGEAHAQEGMPGIRSSTRRFAEQLLPLLAGKSKHIVIELLVANCKPATVAAVQKEQAPVTEHQAQGNQNEFLTLGKYAQRLGIEPQALTPACAEYDAAVASSADSVSRLLTLIADQTTHTVEHLLSEPGAADQVILTYGGALHNDLYPRPGQEAWSFGPKLAAAVPGAYVELDLIVPEFVKDSEAWRNLPWFSAFDREHLSNEALLFRPAPGSFTLIFPKTNTAPAQEL